MKTRTSILLLLIVVLALAIVAPGPPPDKGPDWLIDPPLDGLPPFTYAIVVNPPRLPSPEPLGEQISLWGGGFREYPESQDFHIAHGWVVEASIDSNLLGFWLVVDDEEIESTGLKVTKVAEDLDGNKLSPPHTAYVWVFNFEGGMTDIHTFTGYWGMGCEKAVDAGLYSESCPSPRDIVVVHDLQVEVCFHDGGGC